MKKAGMFLTFILMVGSLLLASNEVLAATDGYYNLTEVYPAVWDGTDANRLKTTTADYKYTYGDEASLTYTLPWSVNFYGQLYNQINVDTNGNVWFGATGSAHSFTLADTKTTPTSPSRGPVIAAWNNDLSSYYYGGVFVQHKTTPNDCVVIEWQTETYTEEGFNRPNKFEVVLFKNGTIRFDYKSFGTTAGKDFGTGISKGDGTASLSLTSTYGNFLTLAGRSFICNGIPKISVTPANASYGNRYVGTTAPPQTFTVSNQRAGTLTMGTITLGGTDASQFSIAANGCNGQSLSSSITCNVQTAFSPTSLGSKTANLLITSNDPTMPTKSIPLTGNGVWPTITVAKNGTGAGTVNAASGISCGLNCSTSFMTGTTLTLTATSDTNSFFAGWSGGGCSGTGSCTITLNTDTVVTATFQALPVKRIPANTYYSSLAAATSAANDGDTIQLHAITFLEGATITKSITLDGGYDSGFVSKIGRSTLKGSQVNINGGIVTIKDVMIDK